MANDTSTIQSLKAVDAWIDVINANINGGVRTAYKSSRLKFGGSNVTIGRAGNATSLPLQIPETGLMTANTVIDFSQGAITASTENTHLALQGDAFFLLASPDMIETTSGASFGLVKVIATAKMYLTRDGEFRTNQFGFLVHSSGYYLASSSLVTVGGKDVVDYSLATVPGSTGIRGIYNDIDNPSGYALPAVRLSDMMKSNAAGVWSGSLLRSAIIGVPNGKQSLRYSSLGSTVFDFGFTMQASPTATQFNGAITLASTYSNVATVLNKSLEASNASMTQSVPELSLAQKLFSALTKVLQISQTNTDAVLNLIR